MPINYFIYSSANLVLFICYKHVNDDHLVNAWKQLYKDPEYTIGMDELVDVRQISDLNVTEKGINKLVGIVEGLDQKLPTPYRTAVVAESDASFGVARMYELMRADSPEQIRVFRKFKDAAHWLSLPENIIDLAMNDIDRTIVNF